MALSQRVSAAPRLSARPSPSTSRSVSSARATVLALVVLAVTGCGQGRESLGERMDRAFDDTIDDAKDTAVDIGEAAEAEAEEVIDEAQAAGRSAAGALPDEAADALGLPSGPDLTPELRTALNDVATRVADFDQRIRLWRARVLLSATEDGKLVTAIYNNPVTRAQTRIIIRDMGEHRKQLLIEDAPNGGGDFGLVLALDVKTEEIEVPGFGDLKLGGSFVLRLPDLDYNCSVDVLSYALELGKCENGQFDLTDATEAEIKAVVAAVNALFRLIRDLAPPPPPPTMPDPEPKQDEDPSSGGSARWVPNNDWGWDPPNPPLHRKAGRLGVNKVAAPRPQAS